MCDVSECIYIPSSELKVGDKRFGWNVTLNSTQVLIHDSSQHGNNVQIVI